MKRSCLNGEEGEPNVNLILNMSKDVSEEFIINYSSTFFVKDLLLYRIFTAGCTSNMTKCSKTNEQKLLFVNFKIRYNRKKPTSRS